jgi:hypothetical protein
VASAADDPIDLRTLRAVMKRLAHDRHRRRPRHMAVA